ncbi:MAG: 4Fe-4S binding protein [Firmicutes bacterium]|nr:4Fe-4S binding protein [Bacillota bacterium]
MIRRIIEIDEARCNGCGICVEACHEGAIGLVDGKAKLLRDDYCDGLGDCLPNCPMEAISFVEREAAAYDEEAVKKNMAAKGKPVFACPGMAVKKVEHKPAEQSGHIAPPSELRQWPIQIKLMPISAPYYDGADLLIAADCTAFSYGDFHNRFMKNRVTVIGCPKLDAVDYTDKLAQILAANDIKSVLLTRMHVPCCGGLENAVRKAIALCGKDLPLEIVTINAEGEIL